MRILSLLLISAVLVTGCAAGGSGDTGKSGAAGDRATGPGNPSASKTPTNQPESPAATSGQGKRQQTIKVSISDGQVRPEPSRIEVEQGTRVTITVSADASDHVHVHGYDKEAHVGPGKPATLTFTADMPGLFEVETHESGLVLFQLAVR